MRFKESTSLTHAIPHLGNMIGSVLSADVFARYQRLKGNDVVFVSGSDTHGTPVAVAAKKLNVDAEELAMKNHEIIKKLFQKWNISYDNYTHTHNPTHQQFVQDFYLDIQNNGYILEKEIETLYCEHDNLYLPDRFVEGECPYCGDKNARGDQCDKCQKLLTPLELKNPHCVICNNSPEIKKTTHWYMNFPKLQEELGTLIEENSIIPSNARTVCLNSIDEGLPERAITRDLEWGIPAKFKGAGNKTIYVWFEAVLGYISAVLEWAQEIMRKPEKFDYFWKDQKTKTVYFIGKDNIIFHLIVFPGLLLAYNKDKSQNEKLVLPYNVSSTEFLMYENDKFSKSRGIGIWIDEALELAPVDYWRFSLIYNRPEKSDTSFLWTEFENNIKILNDNIGNFIHRTLTFITNHFGGMIPPKIKNDEIDESFIKKLNSIGEHVGTLLDQFELKKALKEIVNFGKEGNIYLNEKAPWHSIKDDKKSAGHVFNICGQAVHALAILLAPFIPSTSEKILEYLNSSQKLGELYWDDMNENSLDLDHKINKPNPLFQKLDIVEMQKTLKKIKENKKLVINMDNDMNTISHEDFAKLDIKVGLVENVEKIPNADKLLKLTVNIGTETRTLVAGLAEYYDKKDLIGKKVIVLVNLEPKKLRGVLSHGMLLAADDGKVVSFLTPEKDIIPGSRIR